MTTPARCQLCDTPADVRPGLIWLKLVYRKSATEPVEWMVRCRDRVACRDRVEAAGDEWPEERER